MAAGAPEFLCIGAQKAGTTWLHENLSQHQAIWLPPVKELHVLDHAPPSWVKRIRSHASHHRLAREHFREVLRKSPRAPGELALAWHLAYGRRDWPWYQKLFSWSEGRVAGEICPGYARIDEAKVAEIAARYPKLKVIYLLRDPVDRAWSSVAMHFRKTGAGLVTDHDRQAIMAQLKAPKSFGHCTYRRNIEAWARHFPAEQLYFGFFDRIRAEPMAYLRDVLAFLGVPAGDFATDAGAPVNQGRGEKMDEGLESEIARLLLPEAEYLEQRFANPYTARWLAHARAAAGRA